MIFWDPALLLLRPKVLKQNKTYVQDVKTQVGCAPVKMVHPVWFGTLPKWGRVYAMCTRSVWSHPSTKTKGGSYRHVCLFVATIRKKDSPQTSEDSQRGQAAVLCRGLQNSPCRYVLSMHDSVVVSVLCLGDLSVQGVGGLLPVQAFARQPGFLAPLLRHDMAWQTRFFLLLFSPRTSGRESNPLHDSQH